MWSEKEGLAFHEVSQNDLVEVAHKIIEKAGAIKVWLFFGEMGSGKTTFIKVLAAALGVSDHMSSPTFSIVNEYLAEPDRKVYHFDFYRIKNEAEAYDIGTEEYFYSGNYCFIEWPEKIISLIPAERVEVKIMPENQAHRTIAISVHDR
jgi:tRNA threonylcarbamoyladenosine biosynthesis protein TsaE